MSQETAEPIAEARTARAGVAARVLRLIDDPDASAAGLARTISTDPIFAAKILRVANSTYYGLSGRVSTLPFAVSVVGFQAVRSISVVIAAGLDDPTAAPEGFWQSAAIAATAGELVAPVLEADPGDSFSVGLLHTLGTALLHQQKPTARLCLPLSVDADALVQEELDVHGISHETLAAKILSTWHVPGRVCAVIGRHHQPLLPDAPPLERTLHVARLLTDLALSQDDAGESADADIAWLSQGRIVQPDVPALLVRIRERAEALLDGLQPRL